MALLANQADLLIDFQNYQSPLTYQYLMNVIQDDIDESYFYYNILSDGINNPTSYYIDQNGNKYTTPSTTSPTYISLSTSGIVVKRPILGVGLQTDKISSFILSGSNQGQIDKIYKYVALQKSVAVLLETTGSQNNLVSSNQTKSIATATTLSFDSTQSRGSDVSKTLQISYLNSSFQYVPATLNVDYTLTGPANKDTFSIKFITPKQFRIVLTVTGYDSSNNPYQINNGLICVPTGINSDNVVYYINASGKEYTNIITFPSIDVNIQPDVLLSNNPVSTYAKSNVVASPDIQLGTGSWIVEDNDTGIQSVRSMSLSDWQDEIDKKCNIQLELRNKLTNNLALNPFIGLNNVSFYLNVGDYNLQYIISARKPKISPTTTTTSTSTTSTTTTTLFVPTFVQISNTDTGPGGVRTQVFQIGDTIQIGNKFQLEVYSIPVVVVVVSGDTPQTIITKLINGVNNTHYPYPIVASPVSGNTKQISLKLDYQHQFGGSASAN